MHNQNGYIQRKLFLKMGVSRENFSLKWVYPEKTFLKNGRDFVAFFLYLFLFVHGRRLVLLADRCPSA